MFINNKNPISKHKIEYTKQCATIKPHIKPTIINWGLFKFQITFNDLKHTQLGLYLKHKII